MREYVVTYVVHDDGGRRRIVLHRPDITMALEDGHAVLRSMHPDNYTIVTIKPA